MNPVAYLSPLVADLEASLARLDAHRAAHELPMPQELSAGATLIRGLLTPVLANPGFQRDPAWPALKERIEALFTRLEAP